MQGQSWSGHVQPHSNQFVISFANCPLFQVCSLPCRSAGNGKLVLRVLHCDVPLSGKSNPCRTSSA